MGKSLGPQSVRNNINNILKKSGNELWIESIVDRPLDLYMANLGWLICF